MAKYMALANIHGSLQERESETAAIKDKLQLLHMRIQQLENAMQGVEERQKGEVAKLHQRVTALHQGTIDVKDLAHNCADLLDLRLQCIEESARSRRFLQCSVATVQSEVAVMKSTQTELLTTM